ncbi:hypothetical protein DEO72_LG5g1968 [Vigna unguiculata]|uniref:Uncharacterized protein n=1 Tax=Vigna unguiculata TaxID=3917 RepID=A0A4D6LYC6_VIGUN|nr:hypothetical protein DEO72_LG5g1968 [Vigna unguiculata]
MVVSSSRTNLVSVSKTNLDFAQGKAAGTVDFIFFVVFIDVSGRPRIGATPHHWSSTSLLPFSSVLFFAKVVIRVVAPLGGYSYTSLLLQSSSIVVILHVRFIFVLVVYHRCFSDLGSPVLICVTTPLHLRWCSSASVVVRASMLLWSLLFNVVAAPFHLCSSVQKCLFVLLLLWVATPLRRCSFNHPSLQSFSM